MTYLPPANGGRVNLTIGGNTAGAGALISSGTATLVGGNNITLSQNGNAVTISGGAGGGGGGIALANSQTTYTSGTANMMASGALTIASGAGQSFNFSVPQTSNLSATGAVSMSTNGNTISIGAPTQSVQTQNMFNLTLSGNTTGTLAQVSSGTLTLAGGNNITLSQNGNAVTISGGAGGGGGIALANSQTTYTSGTANLVASGALTIASTTGQSFNLSVPQTSSLSGTGLVSISTNGSTISIGVPTNTMDFYQNMDRGTSTTLGTANGTLMLQRLNQEDGKFAAYITANTFMINMSGNMGTSQSSAHTMTAYVAVYSDNTSALNLINSASSSWAMGANANNSASYNGPRWISFVSSQWSSAPAFVQGAEYVFGVFFRSSNFGPPISYIGQNYMQSVQRSGYMGTSIATNASMAQGNYWNAMYTASTTAFPSAISASDVNRNNATAMFIPHLILNNRYSGTF